MRAAPARSVTRIAFECGFSSSSDFSQDDSDVTPRELCRYDFCAPPQTTSKRRATSESACCRRARLVLENGGTRIGLFHGMFDENILTFNPKDARATP
jgi:AraC-like DNA-binding protein